MLAIFSQTNLRSEVKKLAKKSSRSSKSNKKTESNSFSTENDLKKGRIDGMEAGTWVMFTIIYAVFVGILSGSSKVYLPEIIYIFGLPLDAQAFTWILGIALWGVISILLQAHYKKD